jgi:hypothetical protein
VVPRPPFGIGLDQSWGAEDAHLFVEEAPTTAEVVGERCWRGRSTRMEAGMKKRRPPLLLAACSIPSRSRKKMNGLSR